MGFNFTRVTISFCVSERDTHGNGLKDGEPVTDISG